jgi:hypothetical protein
VNGQDEYQQDADKLSRLYDTESNVTSAVDSLHAMLSVAMGEVEINNEELAVLGLQHNALRGHVGVEAMVKRASSKGISFPNLE